MQIYRAYVRDAAGAVTWAAWIEASGLAEAHGMADALCGGRPPALDLWLTGRELAPGSQLDPV